VLGTCAVRGSVKLVWGKFRGHTFFGRQFKWGQTFGDNLGWINQFAMIKAVRLFTIQDKTILQSNSNYFIIYHYGFKPVFGLDECQTFLTRFDMKSFCPVH